MSVEEIDSNRRPNAPDSYSSDDDVVYVGTFFNSAAPETNCRMNRKQVKRLGASKHPKSQIDDAGKAKEAVRRMRAAVQRPFETNIKCAICLENCVKRDPCSTLCGHIFCKDCIAEAVALFARCPVCMQSISPPGTYHRIFIS